MIHLWKSNHDFLSKSKLTKKKKNTSLNEYRALKLYTKKKKKLNVWQLRYMHIKNLGKI